MKYSDILFEKTCVNLYVQKHYTVCKMLHGDRRGDLERLRAKRQAGRQAGKQVSGGVKKNARKGEMEVYDYSYCTARGHFTRTESTEEGSETGL